jgi:ketosteroid isomerase-like protein
MTTPDSSTEPQEALTLAQGFIHAVEAKDSRAVSATLAPNVRQLFMQSGRATTQDGIADIISGRAKGFCVADVKGKDEVLAYTEAIFDKFTPLIWRDHRWSVSVSGNEVYFAGKGDMVVARTGQPYRNSYVTRFDVEDGKIVKLAEYGNAFMYAGLGIRPNGAEFRALLRAVARMINPFQSARSGR